MKWYYKRLNQAILFYIMMLLLMVVIVLILGYLTTGEMLTSSFEIWCDIVIAMNAIFFVVVIAIFIIVGFILLWEKISKIPEEKVKK